MGCVNKLKKLYPLRVRNRTHAAVGSPLHLAPTELNFYGRIVLEGRFASSSSEPLRTRNEPRHTHEFALVGSLGVPGRTKRVHKAAASPIGPVERSATPEKPAVAN